MYTIGEFSAITGIPKKTLRYYDEINLLKPSNIDNQNSYRQYDESKIKAAEKVVIYKGFGLSLAEIKGLVEDRSDCSLDNILNHRISVIEKEISKLKQQVQYIQKFRKNKIDFSDNHIDFEVKDTEFKSGNILFLDFTEESYELHTIVNKFYDYVSKHNCELLNSHYFKRSIIDYEENIRIFGFVKNKKGNCNIEEIKSKRALEVTSNHLKNKNLAYKQLINFAKFNNVAISDFVEQYNMHKGKLGVTIYGLIQD